MRVIIILLLFAVFFLGGTLYGVNQERNTYEDQPRESAKVAEEEPIIETEERQTVGVGNEYDPIEETTLTPTDSTPAYKAASALETIVSFFYEIVVEVLYQVSRLFY
ncbi:hypothetical protein [Oceanobacillus alkalisoli]|uniref:hypothetical protein n=1 Tax=Oceanobacillus alkalisoli TaxID=2925113 RepID=UPI001EEFB9E4|nr:hypothetical protein [Oceanobacillus alkalisoli]MCF3941819.1 hypothetical protein [Oceanobacillus alkalisoli]MCG5103099.1 hypothetical protein [Oceanobacillus alkalisoli]